jgi:hypothetical protein
MNKPVCYCFGYSEADIERDVRKNKGHSVILERIKGFKAEGTCRCHEKNPSGQ